MPVTSHGEGQALLSADDPASIFTSLLINSPEESIPNTDVSSNRLPKVPWFKEQCKEAIKDLKKGTPTCFTESSAENVQNYKRVRAM